MADFILVGSPVDSVLSIHTTCGEVSSLADITNGGQASVSDVPVTADSTYLIRVAGPKDQSDEEFQLTVDGPGVRRDVFYTYTPRADGIADFALTGSPDDAVLSLHTACGDLLATEINSSRTSSSTQASVSGVTVTADTPVIIRVAGANDDSDGTFGLDIDGPGVRRDVFYSYTPRASGSATFSLADSPADAVLSLHSGCPAGLGTELECDITNGGQASVTMDVTADTTYIIRAAGPMDLSDETFTVNVTGPGVRRDVWYRYLPRAAGTATITLNEAGADSVLSVHSTAAGDIATELDCDISTGSQAIVANLNVELGEDYYIRVAGPKDVSDDAFELTLGGPEHAQGCLVSLHPGERRTGDVHADGHVA